MKIIVQLSFCVKGSNKYIPELAICGGSLTEYYIVKCELFGWNRQSSKLRTALDELKNSFCMCAEILFGSCLVESSF